MSRGSKPDARAVTDGVALASMLLGAGLSWPQGRSAAAAVAGLPLADRLALADAIVGLPRGADPSALDPAWRTDAATAARLLTTAGVADPDVLLSGVASMGVRDRAHVAAYVIGTPPEAGA